MGGIKDPMVSASYSQFLLINLYVFQVSLTAFPIILINSSLGADRLTALIQQQIIETHNTHQPHAYQEMTAHCSHSEQ